MVLTVTEQEEQEINRYAPDVLDDDDSEDDSYRIDLYDVVVSPNDFNTATLVNLIDSGVVMIPGFQRNYVWDIKRASRLIESMIVGLPVPQIFLYEQAQNKFLVIDGQQRLMSIYYYLKERFPRKEKLAELRQLANGRSALSMDVLANDEYFTDFALNLPANFSERSSRFHQRLYSDLDEEYKTALDLRTVRNIIVRQISPKGDDAMYEIFNRLNSGGVNLTPQEIRRCVYDSDFYEMLYQTNTDDQWRKLVGGRIPDVHMKDVEILLRGFAMLIAGDTYRPSMVKFLNRFSQTAKSFSEDDLQVFRKLLDSFLDSCSDLPGDTFHSTPGRFSPMVFEAVFVAVCAGPYKAGNNIRGKINAASLNVLKNDIEFVDASQRKTADTDNVRTRLEQAKHILIVDVPND